MEILINVYVYWVIQDQDANKLPVFIEGFSTFFMLLLSSFSASANRLCDLNPGLCKQGSTYGLIIS
jgi:hypothetical protein